MFGSDKPIENIKNDKLNRKDFSQQLAHAILSYNRKKLILQKLIYLQTMSFEDEEVGLLHISPSSYFERCCWSILKTMQAENVNTVLKDLIESEENESFDILTDMIVQIERSYGRIGNSQNTNFSKD